MPDGFSVESYQNFRDLFKNDLMGLFAELHACQLELFRINFGEIILLPKVNSAERIQQFRSICLLNVCLKIFTKVASIILNSVAVVGPTQTAFMQGRYILDGVIMLHEIIHELHHQKLNGVIFKSTLKKPMIKSNGCFFNKLSV
jgi:hypothetical protein